MLYDDFSGSTLDPFKWTIAAAPLGDGSFWYWRDVNAIETQAGGRFSIDIPKFSSNNDIVQIFDNPKHLYLANMSWPTGGGPARFSCVLAGSVTGDPDDYRDGFASFNVLDFESAMVFDIVTNGHRIWAIYERLLIPGATTPEQAFTEVVDLGVPTVPMREHEVAVEFDGAGASVRFFVDGAELLVRENVPAVPSQLTCGFGLITLWPIENGKSVSCKGQG
ncbi:MAG: hypothetical protein HRF49_08925, partial [bacterium]